MISSVRSEHHVDVEKEHSLPERAEVAVLIEDLLQRPVRRQIDSRPRAGTALEYGNLGPWAVVIDERQLAAKCVLDHQAQGLTPLLGRRLAAASNSSEIDTVVRMMSKLVHHRHHPVPSVNKAVVAWPVVSFRAYNRVRAYRK
jgi:hypothetical protein